jgi:carboxylate-amine ligase
LPLVLALSANSPYWCGIDTGLSSARAKIFEALPNTGVPTAFDSYAEFDRFERRMLEHGSIADRGELWYDVRPHSELGTVEVRAPDAQADPDVVMSFVEWIRALVLDLASRYEDGESGHDDRRELLDDHKWRAIRFGHGAGLYERDFEATASVADLAAREADRLDLEAIRELADRESGAARQRRLSEEKGLDALCESLLLDRA